MKDQPAFAALDLKHDHDAIVAGSRDLPAETGEMAIVDGGAMEPQRRPSARLKQRLCAQRA